MIGVESLCALVDVNRVTAYVPVVSIASTSVAVVIIPDPVIAVVVAVMIEVASIVVTAMPGSIPVISSPAIQHCGAVPATSPTAIPPSAAPASAHQCSHRDSSAKPNNARSGHVTSAVARSHIGRAIDYGWVVLGDVNDLWVRRLDHDYLRALLYNRELGAGLESAVSFGLRTQGLDSCHHLSRLIVICLSKRRGPAEILREVIEHRREFCQRFNGWIPRLSVNRLHQCVAGQTLVLLEPVVGNGNLVRIRARR